MQELYHLLEKIKPKELSEKESSYYMGLLKGNWSTDEEAAKFFWPGSQHRQRNLWNLKDRLLTRLTNTILGLPGQSKIQAVYNSCWKEYATIQILRGMNLKSAALWYSERLLKKALKYELTEIAASIATFLEFNTARHSGARAKQKYFAKIAQQQEEILEAEKKAIRYVMEVSSHFATHQSIMTALVNQAEQYARELEQLLPKFSSLKFLQYTYRLLCLEAQLKGQHQRIIELCQEALDKFRQKDYPPHRAIVFGFSYKPIQAAIKLEDYRTALAYIQKAERIDPPGSINHNAVLLYKAIVGFHDERPKLVTEAIIESHPHRKFAAIKEQWKIIEAYADFLDIDTSSSFRIAKFLNEVPIFSKDKRGNNVAILIVQILFYLKRGKRGKIIDRVEALKLYTHRYLRKDEDFRSNCFIKMLLALVKGNFHPVAVKRYAQPYVDRLREHEGEEVEIVKYERLWGEVNKLIEI